MENQVDNDSFIKNKILNLLNKNEIPFDTFIHEGGETCFSSAQSRGTHLSDGAKSLLLKSKEGFSLFTLRAHLEADSNLIRKILESNKLRFATSDELMSICNVVKGALPPFGNYLYNLPHYIDDSIMSGEFVVFNAGILTYSITLKTSDYLKIVDAVICDFKKVNE